MSRYLFPQDYMADPSAHVFNDKIYVYPSHDWDSGEAFDDDGGHFQMKDYHVLRIDGNPMEADVTDCGKILDVEDVPWAEKQMWDNDVVEVNGKYHLIFAAKDYNGVFRLGVAIADRPEGPFIPQPTRSASPTASIPVSSKTTTGRSMSTSVASGADSYSGTATTKLSKTSTSPRARSLPSPHVWRV